MPADRSVSFITAQQPDDSSRILVTAIEAGDIETIVSLYEPDAILFSKSGRRLQGIEAIRENNMALIALKPVFHVDAITATISADGKLATNRMQATLSWQDKDGETRQARVDTLEVLRRQEDGSWKYVIDDPYGSMRAELQQH